MSPHRATREAAIRAALAGATWALVACSGRTPPTTDSPLSPAKSHPSAHVTDAAQASASASDASTDAAPAPSGSAPARPIELPGMVQIPAGEAIVGSDDGPAYDRPRRKVQLSSYFIDRHEITMADFDACVAGGMCAFQRPLPRTAELMRTFVGPKQPMVPMDWIQAERVCAFMGKRLPTEWEWEKAARGPDGDVYPWGNAPPTCDKAQYRECAPATCDAAAKPKNPWDCPAHATKPVGSYAAGHYGLYDLAGNGYEWTGTWAASPEVCGADCTGADPRGPCQGAFFCPRRDQKILRGGSWYWPADHLPGSHRRAESTHEDSGHRLSTRCATSYPHLTRFPPRLLTEPRALAADPPEPTPQELAIMAAVPDDEIEKVKLCRTPDGSGVDCRDPNHYVKSNEPRQWVFRPYIANLGGGYAGVGSDQAYSFIGAARSTWAWVFDYDPTVVNLHFVLRAFILRSETPAELAARFDPKDREAALRILDAVYADDPARKTYRETFEGVSGKVHAYYKGLTQPDPADPAYGWLRNADQYRYVRLLFRQGRIRILKGNLLGDRALLGVAEAARKLGVPMRVFYTSNAPQFWPFSAQYRKNVRALPFDDRGVVLQTISFFPTGFEPKGQRRPTSSEQPGYWHHNVQHGLQQQERLGLAGYDSIKNLIAERIRTDQPDLTLMGLPSD